jgi:hypothetical protein
MFSVFSGVKDDKDAAIVNMLDKSKYKTIDSRKLMTNFSFLIQINASA